MQSGWGLLGDLRRSGKVRARASPDQVYSGGICILPPARRITSHASSGTRTAFNVPAFVAHLPPTQTHPVLVLSGLTGPTGVLAVPGRCRPGGRPFVRRAPRPRACVCHKCVMCVMVVRGPVGPNVHSTQQEPCLLPPPCPSHTYPPRRTRSRCRSRCPPRARCCSAPCFNGCGSCSC
mgnify:CR=1 FL=1